MASITDKRTDLDSIGEDGFLPGFLLILCVGVVLVGAAVLTLPTGAAAAALLAIIFLASAATARLLAAPFRR